MSPPGFYNLENGTQTREELLHLIFEPLRRKVKPRNKFDSFDTSHGTTMEQHIRRLPLQHHAKRIPASPGPSPAQSRTPIPYR
ncbi:hypothetical protein Hypma_000633 [Hypsizygus marmoreus]|uniref:Uncharacterized protein n=1 Tax=Hypsizygus marmoreus TaxID=39966 RepID=A0A369JCG1_HYPMA|nr:hypothetical protein Hypma_000633 [Hypsizygus marmoreus]